MMIVPSPYYYPSTFCTVYDHIDDFDNENTSAKNNKITTTTTTASTTASTLVNHEKEYYLCPNCDVDDYDDCVCFLINHDDQQGKQQQQQQQGILTTTTTNPYYFKVEYLKRIPFRMTSNLWGKIANIKIPENFRKPIYMTYSKVFGVNVNEAERPVEEYESMADFFSRRLKEDARLIDLKHDLVSPVDGTVIYYGKVDNNSLEQVKGLTYSLEEFLGEKEMAKIKGKNLYHLGIYLSPGDYHGIHSPIDWSIQERYHFPGYLFPVAKVAVDNIPGLFALNERVVLSGQWKHGFFSLTPVGASNVGSIVMDFDKELSTNNPKDQSNIRKEKSEYYHKSYTSPISSLRGNEVAFFKMGSTVILVFEVPQDKQFDFTIKPGQHLKLGEPVGDLK
ncbi:hypothetical protein CYY_008173 [Polysphondylium violaceum]|uniref:phosphatidylserine decarboxylase n=1 Tax=Polysphondylium violaceum TaxID=133409 RepID=A0A8J4PP07_9MYCE|nr:hypothetical protein CYY_008173 [Polysphondylium violaceum]